MSNYSEQTSNTNQPIDAEELFAMASKIGQLPPETATWVQRLYDECLRARMHEALPQHGFEESNNVQENALDVTLAQIALDAAEWLKTLWDVGYMGASSFPSAPRTTFPLVELEDVLKSSLFARIRDGKRPLPFPPPTRNGLPWHELVEGPGVPYDVQAEIIFDVTEQPVGAIIEECTEWKIIEDHANGEYLVQYQSQGPLYHLCLDKPVSVLYREDPRWIRRILRLGRSNITSFLLEWPRADQDPLQIPLRATTWERAEIEASYWIAHHHPEMYGQVSYERIEGI